MIFTLTGLTACGGGGGGGGNVSVTTPPSSSGTNVVALSVNGGPNGNINLPLITIQVCETTSNPTCVTVNNVIVDTGSSGLRVLRSAVSSLSLQNSVSGNPLYECVHFADNSQAWGPVQIADVKIGGKTASATRIQLIGSTGVPEPSACGTSGDNLDSVAALGANAILGVGYFLQDCGSACASIANNGQYFSCTSISCTMSTASLISQVENPAVKFSGDNNGVIIDLPAITATTGVASVAGSLIFGIDTQSNNALGNATIFTPDSNGYLSTTYDFNTYPNSFIDSGSNGFYFPDTDSATLPTCVITLTDFYCPPAIRTLSATLFDANNASKVISFSVINVNTLTNNNAHAANNLAGVYANGFDWGMPFFFGRKVYTAFESKADGPYTAF